MKKLLVIVLGALLIAAGVLSALDVFGIAEFDFSFDGWWTIFIILPAVLGIISDKGDRFGSVALLFVGVYLLLAARNVIEYGMFWKLFVPTLIIIIGVKLIVKALSRDNGKAGSSETSKGVSVFNSDMSNASNVKVAKASAIFGGTKLNLTDADIADAAALDLFCLFGGIELVVPENVEVKMNAFCLFGGISDKRKIDAAAQKTATLTINGFCMFGGADIK